MPMKPTHKATGLPKRFDEFAPSEKHAWICESHKEHIGILGIHRAGQQVDRVNLERCIAFAEEIGADKLSADAITAIADFRDALAALEPVKKRA